MHGLIIDNAIILKYIILNCAISSNVEMIWNRVYTLIATPTSPTRFTFTVCTRFKCGQCSITILKYAAIQVYTNISTLFFFLYKHNVAYLFFFFGKSHFFDLSKRFFQTVERIFEIPPSPNLNIKYHLHPLQHTCTLTVYGVIQQTAQ